MASTRPARPERAAARHADVPSGPSPRRPFIQEVELLRDRLDVVIRDATFGMRSQRDVDEIYSEVVAIGAAAIASTRPPAPPSAAPLWQDGHGRALWG